MVWDPAWGTGNLTRDYRFKELYCSTLNQSDIDTANQMGYNLEAVKFQFDFLNDPDEKLPQGLINAIKDGREIIVLMNPPYGTSSTSVNVKKIGTSDSIINGLMKENQMGKGSQQMYNQFLFRLCNNFGNVNICMFCPPLYLTGPSNNKVRELIFKSIKFVK